MVNYTDSIKPTDKGIHTYLDNLRAKHYQIPTFQREVVWEKNNVKKLWDSIYKFYPIGSILIWITESKLHDHRSIGGHQISDANPNLREYKYILDGQQRTTSLLTSLYGGEIDGKDGFDPTLFVDLTIVDDDEVDDENYKERFLFWDEIGDRDGKITRNTPRKKRYDEGLIVKLRDIKNNVWDIDDFLNNEKQFDSKHPARVQLRRINQVLSNYRISFIELRNIQVTQVCQIFERVNQEGKPLDIFDIVTAKTFRVNGSKKNGFYLRELIEEFRESMDGQFRNIDNHTYLQILAVFIINHIENTRVKNITDRYLNEIRTHEIERVWDKGKESIKTLFDFFENRLHLKGPILIPFRYFYLTLAEYLYDNPEPDWDLAKKYFWYYSFHYERLLRNTTQLSQHLNKLLKAKTAEQYNFEPFIIDKHQLRTSSYSSRGRYSRAILSFLSNREPRDWESPERHVQNDVYPKNPK